MEYKPVDAMRAANRDVANCEPTPFQDCRDVIHIAIFFDGTGNNKDDDKDKQKWSNIARLYEAARNAAIIDGTKTRYPVYISGVGTPFNDKGVNWLKLPSIWMEDKVFGGGTGAGGDRRMEYGGDAVNNQLREALLASANMLGGRLAKYVAESENKSFGEVNAALGKHRLIKVINISIFGFSRGAALARAFSNRIVAKCSRRGEELCYEGYAMRINFMGLFDTVASFGVPAQNARTPFSERELIVPSLVERCVHYVAAHELRFSFPVDLIRKNGKLAPGWIEKTFPGVHSDVGGGYMPTEQGVDNNYARIPLREMMNESVRTGVRMLSYDQIEKGYSSLFKERFECRPETEAAYAGYMSVHRDAQGTVEQQIIGHMKLFYSANGTMHRRGTETADQRSRSANKLKYLIGSKGMAFEMAMYRPLLNFGSQLRLRIGSLQGFAQYLQIHEWKLRAWDSAADEKVVKFLSSYIHDSKVDFLCNAEPFSYFRPRGVDESSISVWAEGGNWVKSKAAVATQAVREAAEVGAGKVTETADVVITGAKEVARAATKAYDTAAKTGRAAVESGKHTVDSYVTDAEKLYENGLKWLKRKSLEGSDVDR
jgi:hypothetical protein